MHNEKAELTPIAVVTEVTNTWLSVRSITSSAAAVAEMREAVTRNCSRVVAAVGLVLNNYSMRLM